MQHAQVMMESLSRFQLAAALLRFSFASISFCIMTHTDLACSSLTSIFSITERLKRMPLMTPLFSTNPSVSSRFKK